MSNLEKIQKGMKVLQILSKIILIFAIVGVVLASIGAAHVASDVLNMENQFLHFLSVMAEMSKGQLVGILAAAASSLLFGGILTAFACRYFTAELKEGTPFTNAGADRIKLAWNHGDCAVRHIHVDYRWYLRKYRSGRMEQV